MPNEGQEKRITVILYGPLAEYFEPGNRIGAERTMNVPREMTIEQLLAQIGIPNEARSYTLLNGDLTSMPGLYVDLDIVIPDEGRIAFFHEKSMWPCQYRMDAQYSEKLTKAMEQREDGGIRQRFDT